VTTIGSVHGVLPPHRYAQQELTAMVAGLVGLGPEELPRLEQVHANAGVQTRHLVLPPEEYAEVTGDFGRANDTFIQHATDLAARAVQGALADAGVTAEQVDLIISTTITGLAVPSLDARLMGRLPLRQDLKRIPIVGLGCVGGAAGLARAHDYLLAHPDDVAVLLSVELCSLTLQRDDTSTANVVASGLFGDGGAAVVLLGENAARRSGPGHGGPVAPRPRMVATRSRFYPDTERAMGWDVGSTGLRIVLGAEVPDLVRANVRGDVDGFLGDLGLTRADIGWWVAHPGGPKVLEALAEALEVDDDALGVTWRSLASIGNLSSASVLHVLADTLRDRPPAPGTHGLLLAMGPGFCLELVLLQAEG
jgi:alkylresorcinol/alkylpyrone synthase